MRCKRRFTTYETIEDGVKLAVIKRDGARVPYDRNKMLEGIRRAAYKRPITPQQIEQIVNEVEEDIVTSFDKEVSSQTIGEKISNVLRRVDKIAYIRFASIYRNFTDVGDFIDEAADVLERSVADIPGQQNLFEEGG
jgi:transcriptional repressor NrdR